MFNLWIITGDGLQICEVEGLTGKGTQGICCDLRQKKPATGIVHSYNSIENPAIITSLYISKKELIATLLFASLLFFE